MSNFHVCMHCGLDWYSEKLPQQCEACEGPLCRECAETVDEALGPVLNGRESA